MKKIIGLLLVIGLYMAAAYYTGVQGEKNIRHQFALSEQQSEAQGVKLVLNQYNRGIFSSDMSFTATYGEANAAVPFGPVTLSSETKMQHGPVLWLGGLGVGLFSSVSTLELTTGAEEFDQGLKEIFGDSIGEIVTQGHFNNSYTAVWSIPEINHTEDGDIVAVAESSLTVKGSYSDLNFVGSFAIGGVEVTTAEGAKVTVTPTLGNFDMTNISEFVSISNMDLAVEKISYLDASMVSVDVEQFKVVQTQKLVNEKIDTAVRFSVEKFKGPVEVSAIYYDIAFNQVDPVALQKWIQLSQKMQSTEAEAFAGLEEEVQEVIAVLLQEGLQFKAAVGADLMDGRARMDLTANYKPLADGRKVSEIVNPEEYLLLVDGELLVTVSESIVNQTPLAMMIGQYVDTYVTLEGDEYRMHGQLKAGQLTMGTVELPGAMLLALLGAGQAADDAQEKGYENEESYESEEDMGEPSEEEYLDE